MADFHVRRDDFFAEDFFYFVRVGAVNWISQKYPVAYGYAHLWLAPADGDTTWSNEDRFYQQWSASHGEGIVSILHRIRLEQRWRDVIINDVKTGDKQFTVRLRYLASFETRIFDNHQLPSFVLSDELLVQFGKSVVYNAFDQNRFFVGAKIKVSPEFSFDIGYMNILQQRSTGYQYDISHVFRLFMYYIPDFRSVGQEKDVEHFENNE
jgi:hypothetical protein